LFFRFESVIAKENNFEFALISAKSGKIINLFASEVLCYGYY
jgi:hypothetical protein